MCEQQLASVHRCLQRSSLESASRQFQIDTTKKRLQTSVHLMVAEGKLVVNRTVVVEGKEGLRAWKEAVHIFQSEDQETAFQYALAIGRQSEDFHEEGRRTVETRLAEIVRLDCRGGNRTSFEVSLGSSSARERLPLEHIFKPEEHMPESPP